MRDPFDIVNDVHHTLSDMRAKEWINMTRQQKTYEDCQKPFTIMDIML